MAALMGRAAWYGTGCCCCGGGRTRSQVRAQERRRWLADWADDVDRAWYERHGIGWLYK